MIWETCKDKFFLNLEAFRASKTLINYRRHLRVFEKFWNEAHLSPIPEPEMLTEDDLLNFMLWMKRKDYSAQYIYHTYITLVHFLEFCGNQNTKAMRANKPAVTQLPPSLSYILTNDDVRKIASVHWEDESIDARNRAAVRLLLSTGARAHEIARLNIEDIKEGEMDIILIHGKRVRAAFVPKCVTHDIRRYVQQYRLNTDERALFTTKRGRITPEMVIYIAREAGKMAGIRFTIIAVRRWLAKSLCASNVPLIVIARLLGYSDLRLKSDLTFHTLQDILGRPIVRDSWIDNAADIICQRKEENISKDGE